MIIRLLTLILFVINISPYLSQSSGKYKTDIAIPSSNSTSTRYFNIELDLFNDQFCLEINQYSSLNSKRIIVGKQVIFGYLKVEDDTLILKNCFFNKRTDLPENVEFPRLIKTKNGVYWVNFMNRKIEFKKRSFTSRNKIKKYRMEGKSRNSF